MTVWKDISDKRKRSGRKKIYTEEEMAQRRKEANKKYFAKYYSEHREELIKRNSVSMKDLTDEQKEKLRTRQRKYYEANKLKNKETLVDGHTMAFWNKHGVSNKAEYEKKKREEYNARMRGYYLTHKDAVMGRNKDYLDRHPEKRKQWRLKYNDLHKEEIKARRAIYDNNNKEKNRDRLKRYYNNHINEIKERNKKYYLQHREEILLKGRSKYNEKKLT